MSFLRPSVLHVLGQFRDVLLGAGLAVLGAWVAGQGGYFYTPLGLTVLLLGGGWAILGWRRQRFQQAGAAPGYVRVTEAEIAFFGPRVGGFISLSDLVEIRLLTLHGRQVWRLTQADGQTLHIPVQALGAGALFDAFATLPGMDTAALITTLNGAAPSDSRALALAQANQLVWNRKGAGVVVR